MRFSCKKCDTPYTIADEKVRGKVIKVRCKKCNHLIVVRSGPSRLSKNTKLADPGVLHDASLEMEFEQAFRGIYDSGLADQELPAMAGKRRGRVRDDPQEWYYGLDGSEEGPFSLMEMRRKVVSGRVTEDHFVWKEGMEDWAPLEEVPALKPDARPERASPPPMPLSAAVRQKADQQARKLAEEREEAIRRRSRSEIRRRREGEERRVREEELEKKRRQAEGFRQRKEEEDRKRRERKQARSKEAQEQKQKAEEQQRQQAEQQQREAEQQQREAEQQQREAEQQQREAEQQQREAEQQQRKAEKQRQQKKRKRQEKEQRLAREQEQRLEEEQEQALRDQQEQRQREEDAHQQRLVQEERDRAEKLSEPAALIEETTGPSLEDRTAKGFFDDAQKVEQEQNELLPPPVAALDELADRLHEESIQEEYEKIQLDPMGVVKQRDASATDEISKVTRIYAQQAGVPSTGRRIGLVIGCLLVVIVVVGGIGYILGTRDFGKKSINKEPSSAVAEVNAVAGTLNPEQMNAEEAKQLRDALLGVKVPVVAPGHDPSAAKQGFPGKTVDPVAAPLSKKEKDLMAFYSSQGGERREMAPLGPRGGSAAMVAAQGIDMPTAMNTDVDLTRMERKVEVAPTGPAKEKGPEKLADWQVNQVIRRHYKRVQSCFERQLKRDSSVSGKMYIVTRVLPNGKVKSVHVETPKFQGTFVEECLTKEIKNWMFPQFSGETYDLHFPLLLSARQSY